MARPGLSGLLLAGAAAYGIYKLSKLSADERTELVEKGKKLVNDNLPSIKNKLGLGDVAGASPERANHYAEEVTYGG